MSEREQVETTRQCPDCGGRGPEADYVGLEMRCVEVECSTCGGTGRLPAPVSQPVAKEFSYFRCLSCGYSGTITEEEIAKHRERCAHGPTVAVDPSPQAEPEPQCVICDSPACSLSANGKYYCSQDKPSWQEEEIEVSSEPKPSPQAEPSNSTWHRQPHEFRWRWDSNLCSYCGEDHRPAASQPPTLPQSSPKAQGFEEWLATTEYCYLLQTPKHPWLDEWRRVWTAAQSQAVAEKGEDPK